MLSGPFVRRPRLAIVLALLVVVIGALSISRMPIAQYPSIAPPTINVTTSYPGASADVVEATVAQPLELAVNGVQGMVYMSSLSNDDGSYTLTVSFDVGTDPSLASVAVQDRIQQVQNILPSEVRQNGITVTQLGDDLLLVYVLYSKDGQRDELFLSNYASLNILDEFQRINGVGSTVIYGQRDYAMRVWLEPERMASLGLTADDAATAVASQNLQAAAGTIGSAPAPPGQTQQLSVTTQGRLSTEEAFGNIILLADQSQGTVTLADVARVELGARDSSVSALFAGQPAVAIGIFMSSDANAVTVAQAAEAQLDALRSELPDGVEVVKIIDTAEFVNAMIETVVETLLIAFALVSFVVFVFLGRFRATLIPLVVAPISIIGAFAIMAALGSSANTITLLALVLAIGIVVDDAIVVVENVERVMEEEPDLSPHDATEKAMREITPSVIAITLVLLSVFVPVAFLPGSTGVLFRQFAIAVSSAVIISAIMALTVSPALAAAILRPGKPVALVRPITATVRGLTAGYSAIVRLLLKVAFVALIALVAVGVFGERLLETVPRGYIPAEDMGSIYVVMSLPAAASLERTTAAAATAEPIILQDPAVAAVATVVGIDFILGGPAPNAGVFFVQLKPFADRRDENLSAFAAVERLRTALAPLPDATFIPVNPPAISGLGRVGGLEYVLEANAGQSVGELSQVAAHLTLEANQLPQIASAFAVAGLQTPRVNLDLDRQRAQELGLDLTSVFTTLQVMLGGSYINDFNLFGRSWTVQMQAEADARADIDDILRLNMRSSNGDMIPMSTIASATIELGPRAIARYDNGRSISINLAAAPEVGTGAAIAAMEALSAQELPDGYSFEWTGQALQEKQSEGRTEIVLALAVFFAYLFLVGLYESWIVPVPVLLSVSVAVMGALYGLDVMGLAFNIYAQIGVVVLIALAAKNAILMVSFTLDAKGNGLSSREAALMGARLRFRPVMMTSVAFIAGLVPLAIATGPGAASMVAVGVPVLFGMLAAALIGIFLIPTLFHVFDAMADRVTRHLTKVH
ncbi:MAG: efflux RND transporter permease subunit [Pseudomonadota bacterium]